MLVEPVFSFGMTGVMININLFINERKKRRRQDEEVDFCYRK